MGCCGNILPPVLEGQQVKEDDVLVTPTWRAAQRVRGYATGRDYGVIGAGHSVYISPLDFAAQPTRWQKIEKADIVEDQTEDVLKGTPLVRDPIGVEPDQARRLQRAQNAPVNGLSELLDAVKDANVQTVLEIRTTDDASLTDFMVNQLGLSVTTVNASEPALAPVSLLQHENWAFVPASPEDAPLDQLEGEYDLVVFSGVAPDQVGADVERFAGLARVAEVYVDAGERSFFGAVARDIDGRLAPNAAEAGQLGWRYAGAYQAERAELIEAQRAAQLKAATDQAVRTQQNAQRSAQTQKTTDPSQRAQRSATSTRRSGASNKDKS